MAANWLVLSATEVCWLLGSNSRCERVPSALPCQEFTVHLVRRPRRRKDISKPFNQRDLAGMGVFLRVLSKCPSKANGYVAVEITTSWYLVVQRRERGKNRQKRWYVVSLFAGIRG